MCTSNGGTDLLHTPTHTEPPYLHAPTHAEPPLADTLLLRTLTSFPCTTK
jgi:hypothetical protein